MGSPQEIGGAAEHGGPERLLSPCSPTAHTHTHTHTHTYIHTHKCTLKYSHEQTLTEEKGDRQKNRQFQTESSHADLGCCSCYVQITSWGGPGSHSRRRPHPCLTKVARSSYLPPASILAAEQSFPTHRPSSGCKPNKHTSVPASAQLCLPS